MSIFANVNKTKKFDSLHAAVFGASCAGRHALKPVLFKLLISLAIPKLGSTIETK